MSKKPKFKTIKRFIEALETLRRRKLTKEEKSAVIYFTLPLNKD
jgi:hypothetical protein